MDLIQIEKSNHLLVGCASGTTLEAAIAAATTFCKEFTVRSIVISHNDRLIQVNQRGVVRLEVPEPKGPP